MAQLTCQSGSAPTALWKPRLYLACHPKDHIALVPQVQQLISDHRACDIYSRAQPDEPLSDGDREQLLGTMNLFVIPVTMDLLATENDIMDKDIPFARSHNIPILPILMSPDIYPAYSLPRLFGKLPCVDATCDDDSYLSTGQQLSLLLDSMLVSNRKALLALSLPEGKKQDAAQPYLSGIAYLAGIGRTVNTKAALRLLNKAAQAGDTDAMEQLYRVYLHGIGAPIHYDFALQWAARLSAALRDRKKLENWTDALQFLCTLPIPLSHFDENLASLVLLSRLGKLGNSALHNWHPTALLYQRILADHCYKSTKYEQLLETSRQLTRIMDKLVGPLSPEGLTCRYREALANRLLGNTDEAIQLLTELCQDFEDTDLPEELSVYSASLYHLASLTHSEGHFEEALLLAQKCYRLRVVHLGSSHPFTLYAMLLQGRILGAMDRNEEALSKRRTAYHRLRRRLGAAHPETLEAQIQVAMAFHKKKDHERARNYIRGAYETYRDFYGEDHKRTQFALHIYNRFQQSGNED